MNRCLRYALGVLVVLGTLVSSGVPSRGDDFEWRVYSSKIGRFTAKFPGEVTMKEMPNATHFSGSPPGLDADFRVAFTDRKEADANFEASFKELKRIRDATAESQKITLEDEIDFLFAGLPACKFHFDKDVGTVVARYQMVYIMDGKRFYQLVVGYDVKMPLSAEAEKFVKSFRIER
ncbi:MAG: hypothetical protein U0935_07155 [Pirellulales bacterium]